MGFDFQNKKPRRLNLSHHLIKLSFIYIQTKNPETILSKSNIIKHLLSEQTFFYYLPATAGEKTSKPAITPEVLLQSGPSLLSILLEGLVVEMRTI